MASETPIPYAADWPVIQLGEITHKIGSGATPTGGSEAYIERRDKFALIRSQNVFDRRFDGSGLAFITDAQAQKLQNACVMPGDLLLNITGDGATFSRACAAPLDILPACVNQHVAIIRVDPRKADFKYVLSFLTHPLVKRYIESFNAGGSRRAITKAHIESFRLPLPPIEEQAHIGDILASLDDKIELNRRMAETLEEMARAIFKSWFVNFDPVRAKAEGRPTGLPDNLAALFPDSRGEDGLPEGWDEKPLTEFLLIIGGGTPKTSVPEYWNGTIQWFSVTDTPPAGNVFVVETAKTITEQGMHESSARLVPKGTTIISARGTVGNLAVAGQDMTFNQSCYALRGNGAVGDYFTYLSAQHMVGQLQSMAHGSVFSTITRQTFEATNLPKPDDRVLRKFELAMTPLFDRILASVKESHTLAVLRDTLLPKLISGKLRIADAERRIAVA